MPRPIEYTPWRRFLEQAIMWIVLLGTVGMAALVDAQLNRLGAVREFGNVRLRLPQGWIPTDEHGEGQIQLRERGERYSARTITVRHESARFSLNDIFNATPRRRIRDETHTLPDGTVAQVRVLRRRFESGEGMFYELETMAIVPAPAGPNILITLKQISFDDASDAEAALKLMRRILQTVQFPR